MNKYIKISIIIAVVCICFIIGWWIGKITIYNSPIEQEEVTLTENVFTVDTEKIITPEKQDDNTEVFYSIASSEESIYLYEISGGEKSIVASKSIETELLPVSDREKLSEGITVESYSEALKIWEGYVS